MKRPIFIVGANRSGTTLLRLILNAHSEIAIPDELTFFRGFMFHLGDTNWRNASFTPSQYEYFVKSFLERNVEELRPLDCSQLEREILAIGGNDIKIPYKHVLEAWATVHGKSRWGEKTPGNLFYAEDIRHMFPDAQFIYMVRDPRGGVLSMKRASIYSVDTAINALNRHYYMADGLRHLEQEVPADDRTIVRYEDLLEEPEGMVRSVCTFLGIEYEPKMLNYHATASRFMNERSAKDINKAANRPILKEKAETWRRELTEREIAIVEEVCREDMQRHGYQLDGTPVAIADRPMLALTRTYWHYQMWKHREVPGYQVMHGVLPRFRSQAAAGSSVAAV